MFKPLFSFDEKGNPTPYEVISTTLAEIGENFAGNDARQRIFDGLVGYISDLRALVLVDWRQWINGSFTTQILHPNDTDVVNFVPWSEQLNANKTIFGERFWATNLKRIYRVDGHFFAEDPAEDARHSDTLEMVAYWTKCSGNDRNGRPKGSFELKHPAP